MDRSVIGIIPARGGSKRVPRKNIRTLLGKPLIVWTFEAARQSLLLDRYVVSTEDNEIAEISQTYGVEVIQRPEELAMDDTPSLPVFQHAIEHLEGDIIVILQPTSPLRTGADIDGAIELITGCDSVMSVYKEGIPNGAVYVTHRHILKDRVLGEDTRYYFMPEERSIDIDTEADFKLAELLMEEYAYAKN